MKKIDHDTGTIYYDLHGEGVPIIFIHPPGMGRVVFEYQKLLAKKYSVILPDLSGHGLSTSIDRGSIIDRYVKELKLILENESYDSAIICGYSAGGMIAQQFALEYPESTAAVVLSGGYPKVASAGLAIEYRLGMGLLKKSPNQLANVLAMSHANTQSDRVILYNHIIKSNVTDWLTFYGETYRFNIADKLPLLTMPILVCYGQYAYWIKKHKSFYEQLSNSEIIIVNNTLHQVPTKRWQAFNHLVQQFIESITS